MESGMDRPVMNFFSIWMVSVFSLILPIVIMLTLGRTYSIEEFGNYSVAASFMGIISIFLTFGLGNVVSFEVASISSNGIDKISSLLISSLIILFCFTALGCSVTWLGLSILNYNKQTANLVILLGFGYWFIGSNSVLGGVFMGIKKMYIPAISSLSILISACLFVFPCLLLHLPVWIVALSWSISQGVGCIATLFFLFHHGYLKNGKPSLKQTKMIFRRSIGIGFDGIISRLGSNLTNAVLPLYLSSYQIGIFNGAFKPFMLLAFASECCLRFSSPYIAGCRYLSKDKIEEQLFITHKIVTFFTVLFLSLPFMFSETIISFVFGTKFIDSAPYMVVLSLGYLIYYLPPQSPPLVALGLEWKVIWCSIAKLFFNFVCIIVLVPKFGIMGAVAAISISLLAYWCVTVLIYFKQKIKPLNNSLRYIMFAVVICFAGYIVQLVESYGVGKIIIFILVASSVSLIVFWNRAEKEWALSQSIFLIRRIIKK